MVEVIIDTNADIDVLLRELQRLSKSLKSSSSSSGRCVLTWGYVCADTTLQELFQERLSSVMGAAKSQRTVHFPRERLILGSHAETEIELLAPHLRILPESAIQSRSRQEERKAAFKEAKTKALEEHREKMLRLVMQGIEMPRAAAPSAVAADVKSSGDESGSEDGDLPPPPPPADDGDSGQESDDEDDDPPPPPPPPPDDEDEDENDDDEEDEEDEDDPPPPPPPE